ncbi:MAG: hypothetical protein J6K17_13305 [Oscillospiraceae bacterium]|nr:hypothetical protein [Oscillospiraceae bacterium]
MNFTELFSTTGSMLFYGGIIGAVFSVVLSLILIPIFSASKKKMLKKIESEYKSK